MKAAENAFILRPQSWTCGNHPTLLSHRRKEMTRGKTRGSVKVWVSDSLTSDA
jgi:hypothetical protein